MPNIQITLEYEGTRYAGWQAQRGKLSRSDRTVQQVVEKALAEVLKEPVDLIGASRTDAGVHARGQSANFSYRGNFPPEKLQGALNARLPEDIAVTGCRQVGDDFHSRYAAAAKQYRYEVICRKVRPVLERDRAHWCPQPLDVPLMRAEASVLAGRHDFKAFEASDAARSARRSSIRTVRSIRVSRRGERVALEITGSGFLHHMVRNIAGTLLDIGRGKLPPGSMRKILASRDRKKAGPTAPACGLTLVKVFYNSKKPVDTQ
jgi:tRNA pseudouridine38-40 synthase